MELIPWRRKKADRQERGELSLSRLRDEVESVFDRVLRDPWNLEDWGFPLASGAGWPRLDVAEDARQVTVTLEAPGTSAEDLDIDVTGTVLTVRGRSSHENVEEDRSYRLVERYHGDWQRNVQLPAAVDPDKVDARLKDGVLTITIEKDPSAAPRTIAVKAD